MKRLTLLCMAIGMFGVIQAQNEGEITGKVYDPETGKAVPLAHIIVSSEGKHVMDVESDFNGMYTASLLKPSTYDLKAVLLGFDTVVITGILVGADAMVYQDILMSEGIGLDPFEYKIPLVSKNDMQEETTITGTELRQQGNDNIVDAVVKNVPKVIPNERTGGISIAGSREDAILYVIDGVRVVGSAYLPMNSIKEVNVITGGIPAAYGDFMGGVIEITTKNYAGVF